jgi:phage terminase small subunit
LKKKLPVNIDDLGLTPREIKFVGEYITNGYKVEDAAREAGLLEKNAGIAATRIHCARLLSDTRIKEAIRRTQDSFIEPYRDTHYAKIQEVLEVRAFYEISDFYEADGTPKPLNEIPVKSQYAIDDIKDFNAIDKNGNEHRVITGYVLANRDKARAELRNLHERQKEEDSSKSNAARDELFNLVSMLKSGYQIGRKVQAEIPEPVQEAVPPMSATVLAKKIRDGEYGV